MASLLKQAPGPVTWSREPGKSQQGLCPISSSGSDLESPHKFEEDLAKIFQQDFSVSVTKKDSPGPQ